MDIINNQELDVLNYHSKCEGKWTHVVRTTNTPSVLDYILSCKEVTSSVQHMIIDELCLHCPFSVKKSKGKISQKFSDHNAMILRFQLLHHKKEVEKLPKAWKITEGGIQKLVTLSDHMADTYDEEKCENTFQERYNSFEASMYELMDKCFHQRKIKKNKQVIPSELCNVYKKISDFRKKGKAQRIATRKYMEEIRKNQVEKAALAHKTKIQRIVENLTVSNTFSPDGFWKLCKKAKKEQSISTSVETEDGVEIYGDDMIRNAYMNEFKHRLRKRDISYDLKRV